MDIKLATTYIAGGFLLLSILIPLWFKYFYKKKTKRKQVKSLTQLIKHPIFNNLEESKRKIKQDFRVNQNVKNYQVKENIFRDMIYWKIVIIKELLLEFAKKIKCIGNCSKCMSTSESLEINNTLLIKCKEKYREYWKYNGQIYTDQEIETIKIAMDKFVVIHEPNELLVLKLVKSGHNVNKYFVSNHCTLAINSFILFGYDIAFFNTYTDLEECIDKMNGDFDNLEFAKREYK